MDERQAKLQAGYDRVASQYVAKFIDELDRKAFDRDLLNRFAERLLAKGPVCDLGCGPGQIARYLNGRGAEVLGVDLSAEMVAQAQQLSPHIPFRQGDMLALDAADESWAGIAAFYSIIHIARTEAVRALREMWRVLRREGLLLLSFHGGQEIIHLDEWWGEAVSMDFVFYEPDEMAGYLKSAGFEVEEIIERRPYESEYPSRRVYVLAKKPGGQGEVP